MLHAHTLAHLVLHVLFCRVLGLLLVLLMLLRCGWQIHRCQQR